MTEKVLSEQQIQFKKNIFKTHHKQRKCPKHQKNKQG